MLFFKFTFEKRNITTQVQVLEQFLYMQIHKIKIQGIPLNLCLQIVRNI